MPVSVESAAEIYRDSMRTAVRRYALFYLSQSVLLVAAGVLAILFPVFAAQAVIVAVGWLLVLSGVLQAISLISARHTPDVWLQLISAVLALLIGFLVLRDPAQSLGTLTLLIVIFFMIEGVSKLVWALTIQPISGWIWVLLSGILGIVLSVFLIINLADVTPWLLATLFGIQLIGIGAAIGYMAWTVRKATA